MSGGGNPAYDSRDTDNLNWQEETPSGIGENKGSGRQQAQLQKIGQDNVNFFCLNFDSYQKLAKIGSHCKLIKK